MFLEAELKLARGIVDAFEKKVFLKKSFTTD